MITRYDKYIKESIDNDITNNYVITISSTYDKCRVSTFTLEYSSLTNIFRKKIQKILKYHKDTLTNKDMYKLQLEILLKSLLFKDKCSIKNTNDTYKKLLITITTNDNILKEILDSININTLDQKYTDDLCEIIFTKLVSKDTKYLDMIYYKEYGNIIPICSDDILNKYKEYFNAKNFDLL